jgi:hypothetical protein
MQQTIVIYECMSRKSDEFENLGATIAENKALD